MYHTNMIRRELEELLRIQKRFLEKHEKYTATLSRLMLVNAGSNALSVCSGVGAIATGVTVLGIPLAVGLGGVAVTGAFAGAITTAIIKRYQNKLGNNEKAQSLLSNGIATFETSISVSLSKNTLIDSYEFTVLQTLYYRILNELSTLSRKMESETRSQYQKNLMEEINSIKNTLKARPS